MKRHIYAIKQLLKHHVAKINDEPVGHTIEVCTKNNFHFETKVCDAMYKNSLKRYGQYNEMDPLDFFEELKSSLLANDFISDMTFENSYLRFNINPEFKVDYLKARMDPQKYVSKYENVVDSDVETPIILELTSNQPCNIENSALVRLFKSMHNLVGYTNYQIDCNPKTKIDIAETLLLLKSKLKTERSGSLMVKKNGLHLNNIIIPFEYNADFTPFISSLDTMDTSILNHSKDTTIYMIHPYSLLKESFYYGKLLSSLYIDIIKIPYIEINKEQNADNSLNLLTYIRKLIFELNLHKKRAYFKTIENLDSVQIGNNIERYICGLDNKSFNLRLNSRIDAEIVDKQPVFFNLFVKHLIAMDLYSIDGSFRDLELAIEYLLNTIEKVLEISEMEDGPYCQTLLNSYIIRVFS